MATRKLNGWHVLAIFGGGFGVIIGVNLLLAYKAVTTFPGLEVRNTYVASQTFDRDRTAQNALGWTVSADAAGTELFLSINDETGPVVARIDSATLGRPTTKSQDVTPVFRHDGTRFVADIPPLGAGNWNLRLVATAPDGTAFRQRLSVRVAP